jgi:hypothetical protein
MKNIFSPILKKSREKETTMSFFKALEAVANGKNIHKLEWIDKNYYGFLNGDVLSLHKPDGQNYKWIINDGDLNGTDWIIL